MLFLAISPQRPRPGPRTPRPLRPRAPGPDRVPILPRNRPRALQRVDPGFRRQPAAAALHPRPRADNPAISDRPVPCRACLTANPGQPQRREVAPPVEAVLGGGARECRLPPISPRILLSKSNRELVLVFRRGRMRVWVVAALDWVPVPVAAPLVAQGRKPLAGVAQALGLNPAEPPPVVEPEGVPVTKPPGARKRAALPLQVPAPALPT